MDEGRERKLQETIARLQKNYDPAKGQSRPEEIAQDFDQTSFAQTDDLSERVAFAKEGYLLGLKQSDLDQIDRAKENGASPEMVSGLQHDIGLAQERRARDIESDPKWLKVREQVENNHARDYDTISERFGQARDETLQVNGHDPDPETWEINQKRDAPEREGTPPQELPLWEAAERREATFDHVSPERQIPERDLNRTRGHDLDR